MRPSADHALAPFVLGAELDTPGHVMHGARARAPGCGAGIFEERDVVARRTVLVAVEEVVDRRVVLVDRLLDEAKAEHSRVEVDVARGVAGDRRYVVDALELHDSRLALMSSRSRTPGGGACP